LAKVIIQNWRQVCILRRGIESRNGYKKRFIKKEKEEKAHYNDYMLMGKCIEYYIPFFINKVRVKCNQHNSSRRRTKCMTTKRVLVPFKNCGGTQSLPALCS
jgi:hypothetical protein